MISGESFLFTSGLLENHLIPHMTLHVDYLVGGAGAMGMPSLTSFFMKVTNFTLSINVRRTEGIGTPLCQAIMSAFYGVNSRALGDDLIDKVGWNKGLYELASKGEVCAYYDRVMREQFLQLAEFTTFEL